jgi:hypothetical protein
MKIGTMLVLGTTLVLGALATRGTAEEPDARELMHRVLERLERLEHRMNAIEQRRRGERRVEVREVREERRGGEGHELGILPRLIQAARNGDDGARERLAHVRREIDQALGAPTASAVPDRPAFGPRADREKLQKELARQEELVRQRRNDIDRHERARADAMRETVARKAAEDVAAQTRHKQELAAELEKRVEELRRMVHDLEARLEAEREKRNAGR